MLITGLIHYTMVALFLIEHQKKKTTILFVYVILNKNHVWHWMAWLQWYCFGFNIFWQCSIYGLYWAFSDTFFLQTIFDIHTKDEKCSQLKPVQIFKKVRSLLTWQFRSEDRTCYINLLTIYRSRNERPKG